MLFGKIVRDTPDDVFSFRRVAYTLLRACPHAADDSSGWSVIFIFVDTRRYRRCQALIYSHARADATDSLLLSICVHGFEVTQASAVLFAMPHAHSCYSSSYHQYAAIARSKLAHAAVTKVEIAAGDYRSIECSVEDIYLSIFTR